MGRNLTPELKRKIAGILAEKNKLSGKSAPQTNNLHPNLAMPTPASSMSLPTLPKVQSPIFQQGADMLNKGKFFSIKKKLAPGKF